jgi:phosphate:Na+ symporter
MIVMTIIRAAGGFPELWESTVNSCGIANFQTIFNLLTAIALIPFTNMLVWIGCKCVKDDEEEVKVYPELAALDNKLMGVPAVALGGVTKVASAMAEIAKENIVLSLNQFNGYDEDRAAEIASN